MRYVATISVPGYLPTDDDPPTFDTAREAWEYLASERRDVEDDYPNPDDPDDSDGPQSYTQTVLDLEERAGRTAADGENVARVGTVYGPTPGYDRDGCGHDLGLAYSVDYAEDDAS